MQLPGSPPPDETSHFPSEAHPPDAESLKAIDNQHQRTVPGIYKVPALFHAPPSYPGSLEPARIRDSEESKPLRTFGYLSHQATSNGTMGSDHSFLPPTQPPGVTPSIPFPIQNPYDAGLWKAVDDQYRHPNRNISTNFAVLPPLPSLPNAIPPALSISSTIQPPNNAEMWKVIGYRCRRPDSNIPTNFTVPQPPAPLPNALPSAPGHSSDIELAQRWKAIGDYYRSPPTARNPISHPMPPMPPMSRPGCLTPEAIQDLELAMKWIQIGHQYRRSPSHRVPVNSLGRPLPAALPPPPAHTMPGGVHDPVQAKLWKTIGDQYRRGTNDAGNTTQVCPLLGSISPGRLFGGRVPRSFIRPINGTALRPLMFSGADL